VTDTAPAAGQPYAYRRRALVEPDWTRLPGWRGVTREQWESAQWQRAHCVKNVRQLRAVLGDLIDEHVDRDVLADLLANGVPEGLPTLDLQRTACSAS